MSVEHIKRLLTNADVRRFGGQCHLRAIALWIDAGKKAGLPNARIDQLEVLLPCVDFRTVGHEAFDDVLASDYDIVNSPQNR